MNLLFAAIVAMSVTMALIPPLAQFATRLRVLDWPAARKVHRAPSPRSVG
jgi:UDP-GlcNAc:undecaprenyl-phosphate/decaprenyl-phosphate GlcNAc-1-phosphate transferase